MSFKEIGDNELIYLIRNNNYEAKTFLIQRYKGRMYGIIKSFVIKHKMNMANIEDYYQSCFITFLRCIELYNEEFNFRNYLKSAIENMLYKVLKKEKEQEECLSMEDEIYDRDIYLMDQVNEAKTLYLESEVEDFINKNFIEIDKKIIKLKMEGYNCLNIANILRIDKKEVYKRLSKIKQVIKEKDNQIRKKMA